MVKRAVVLEVPLSWTPFTLFHSYNFYCRFAENDCSFDGLLTLRESGRHSIEELCEAVAIFMFLAIKSTLLLCHVMKMCCVCYYNNSDATFRLLMSGDTNLNPGPVSASTAGKINCFVMNARSLRSYHKDSTTNWQSVCNVHHFQGLVYAENSDVICFNETWLNPNISNSEILHSSLK